MLKSTIHAFLLVMPVLNFFSCTTKERSHAGTTITLILPDTANNNRAVSELNDLKYKLKIAKQLGLRDLRKGADTLEIRCWRNSSFSIFDDLYIMSFRDTSCLLSYYRIYPRQIDPEHPSISRIWNPLKGPIVDSFASRSVLLQRRDYCMIPIDSIWLLKSQSELHLARSLGFTDCNSYFI